MTSPRPSTAPARAQAQLPAAPHRALQHLAPEFQPTAGRPAVPLTGGLINHVWRLRAADSRTLILKYAPPHLATDPTVPLDPSRLDFEARALALFAPGGPLSSAGSNLHRPRAPYPRFNDARHHVLLLEDVGPAHDLASAVAGSPRVAAWGHALGRFIATVHATGTQTGFLVADFANRAVQQTRFDVQYAALGPLARTLKRPQWRELDRRARALGRAFLRPGRCLVMGDLWPRSVLVTAGGELRVIDWEFAHHGQPAQDIGHFAAHCWMQEHTAPTCAVARRFRRLWRSFFTSYRRHLHAVGAAHLDDASTQEQLNAHAGAEIFMRCIGPFSPGYVYADLPATSPLVESALTHAERLLLHQTDQWF